MSPLRQNTIIPDASYKYDMDKLYKDKLHIGIYLSSGDSLAKTQPSPSKVTNIAIIFFSHIQVFFLIMILMKLYKLYKQSKVDIT